MQIVTGSTGELHVTSAMDGALNAGAFGTGCHVLPLKSRLACADSGSGFATISPGDVVMHGRHGVVQQAETLTLEPGSAGVNRNDLICVRYEADADGVESMALVVVKGTPVSGTAADPAYNATSILDGASPVDFPLYRIPFAGPVQGSPQQLFEVLDGGIRDLWLGKAAKSHVHPASDVASGTLPVARGGTGLGSSPSMLVNLAGSGAANVLQASPRPGVTGTLPVARGGTGRASNAANGVLTGNGGSALKNVASANGALFATAANGAPRFGVLPVAQGGTGSTSAAAARRALQVGYGTALKTGIHLTKGGNVSISNLSSWYALVATLTTSSSSTSVAYPCLLLRTPGTGSWQLVGGYDDGSASYSWVGRFTNTDNVLSCQGVSRHKLASNMSHDLAYVTALYGAW